MNINTNLVRAQNQTKLVLTRYSEKIYEFKGMFTYH